LELVNDKRFGPIEIDEKGYFTLASVMECPKCGGYMKTIPVDMLSASLINCHGRWRCTNCGWIPSLGIFDAGKYPNVVLCNKPTNP